MNNIEKLGNALISAMSYNHLYEYIDFICEYMYYNPDEDGTFKLIHLFLKDDNGNINRYDYGQVEIIHMCLVLICGEYGTSPRSGWIPSKNFNKLLELRNYIYEWGDFEDE